MTPEWHTGGALPPPEGTEPDFDDPPSQLQRNIGLHAVFLSLTTLAVAMRLFTRTRVLRTKLGIDDLFTLLAYCLSVTFMGLMTYCFTRGFGRHMWDVRRAGLTQTFKYFTISQYIYTFLTAAVKLALLFFYYRIFPRQLKTVRRFVTFGVVFVTVSHLVLLFLTIFSCSPVGRAWEATSPGSCWHQSILPWISAALSTSTDLYVLLLPVRPLWGLNMTTRKKFRLAVVFSLGTIAFAASLGRLVMTHVLANSPDATWNLSRISQWTTVEADTGIICACLPLLPALLDKYWPKSLGSSLYKLWSSSSPKSSSPAEDSEVSLYRQQQQQQAHWQYRETPRLELGISTLAKNLQHENRPSAETFNNCDNSVYASDLP